MSELSNISPGALSCKSCMESAGLPEVVIANFLRLYQEVEEGRSGIIGEEDILPVPSLDSYHDVAHNNEYREAGEAALSQLVVCKLNGGLGTGMGLDSAKSLLPVKASLSFNHIIAEQLLFCRAQSGCSIPLLHMTSFSTEADILGFMEQYPSLQIEGLASNFNQHKHPKIYADNLLPAQENDEVMNWNPPGHGDLYAALMSTGTLDRLIAAGKRYIFVSNADNLGAMPDVAILGYLVCHKMPFLLEVAERTAADSKGGHLALRKSDHRLILREAAQAPTDADGSPSSEFQDIARYRYFNSNSQWGDLLAWQNVARDHRGIIPLPLIRNQKNVNPRDNKSRKVYQIETAMGAAIEVFNNAGALLIPRSRFSPVKTTNDLLAVRSDAYVLQRDNSLVLDPSRDVPPVISLDSRYYKLVDEFDRRFKHLPSLLEATELSVSGDFVFNVPLVIKGRVKILDERSAPSQFCIEDPVKELADEVLSVTDRGIIRTRI